MANARINIFENYPLIHKLGFDNVNTNGGLRIHGVNIPGSISFNNIAMGFSASGTTAKTMTISFGLYSLNGSTLSLANSASTLTSPTANTGLWIILETSATQDITPGSWYFGVVISTSSNSRMSLLYPQFDQSNLVSQSAAGGFFAGYATTNGLPASIATSDFSVPGQSAAPAYSHPCIIISA